MKLIEHFDSFLRDAVNLNQTRIDRLNDHVDAIKRLLQKSDYSPKIRRFSEQGSWAHKTIIKPPEGKEFDADLVMLIEPIDDWSPKDYIEDLYQIFKASKIYEKKVCKNTRCVTLDYAGDFHLDVVPCVIRENLFWVDRYEVCNRREDKFESTDPEGYTNWLIKRNDWTGRNMLRKVTRLIKYLRDVKDGFAVNSILLTTLLGNQVSTSDLFFQDSYFPDVPTALKTLINRLDEFLQQNLGMPFVKNPVLETEDFNRHWDQTKYDTFRSKIHEYRELIDDAYTEKDRDESIQKWRNIFGNDFAKGEVVEKAASVRKKGAAILAGIPISLPYIQAPPWSYSKLNFLVFVYGVEYLTRQGEKIRSISSGNIIEKNRWVRFNARQSSGLPFPQEDYRMQWRVVNTGREAAEADQLRGDFYKSDIHGVRWEQTRFRGAHWVEAFLISKRNGLCCGKSQRFFVVIE